MYTLKMALKFLIFLMILSPMTHADECEQIFEKEKLPSVVSLEKCRDYLEVQSLRDERPVFQTQLNKDLVERMIYVLSERETCFEAREAFFSDYGIKNRQQPEADMGEELKIFWRALKKACPKI